MSVISIIIGASGVAWNLIKAMLKARSQDPNFQKEPLLKKIQEIIDALGGINANNG